MRVHHNTTKRAVRAGIELVIDGDMVNAIHNGRTLARHADPKEALETALRELNGGTAPKRVRKPSKARKSVDADEGDEDGEFDGEEAGDEEGEEGDESDADQGKSIVKQKYRKKYQPHKHTCGDSLTQQIRKEFMTKIDPDTKKAKFDFARFVRFAKANGVWVPAYGSLNHGMARMNVANRLRAKIRKKAEIDWNVE